MSERTCPRCQGAIDLTPVPTGVVRYHATCALCYEHGGEVGIGRTEEEAVEDLCDVVLGELEREHAMLPERERIGERGRL